METGNARYYEFGEFRLDSRRRILLKNGAQIPLSARIFDLLLVMVQNEGRILSHDELLNMVWGETFVEQSNLKKSVSALRQTLGEEPNESLYIKTVPRRGYSFISPVRLLPDEQEAPVYQDAPEVSHTEEIKPEIEKPADLPVALPIAQPTGFFARLRKYQIALALILILLLLTGSYFAARNLWSKPTFNYSVENVRPRRLTSEGNLGNAAPISPDGNYIVYPVYFGDQGSLWLRQVQTGSVARLTPMMEASFWAYEFSPDGNYVYYILNHQGTPSESGLFRIPTLGGAPQRLIDRANGGLTFAPDGSRFAFSRVTEDRTATEVVSAKADGSDLKRAFIVPENKNLWSLKWSPDSLNLLYSVRERRENELYGYVAETRWDNNSDTPVENIVYPKQKNQVVINSAWLPDKTSLLLSLRELNADICQLWQYIPSTGEKRRITNDDNSYRIINLSRDGKTFSTVQENWKSEIWTAETAALDFQALNAGKNSRITLWTKDNKLIYEGFENQQATIWLTDVEGNVRKQLTTGNDGIYLYPSLSQNGDALTFVSNRSGTNQIWRINLDGTDPRQLTNSATTISLRSKLLSDGQTLLFMALSDQSGWRLLKQTADGQTTPLTQTQTDLWSLSPDEKSLAVIVRDEKTKKYKVQVQNVENGEVYKTFDFSVNRQLSWTRDGKSLVYISSKQNSDELIFQPLDETPPKVLSSTRGERIASFDWSFDGTRLIVVRNKYITDAFLFKAEENL